MTIADKLRAKLPNMSADCLRLNAGNEPLKLAVSGGPIGVNLMPVAAKKRIRQSAGDGLNKWEREYLATFNLNFWHVYPQFYLPLANGLRYKLDFLVVDRQTPPHAIEGHEVKGFARSTGIAKVKMAARLYPWITFRLVTKRDGKFGGWDVEKVLP